MKLDHAQITQAIQAAEKATSGEIQVFVTRKKVADPYLAAQKVFEKIGLGKTKEKNAILFFIAESSKCFAIIGDIGIHQKVGPSFWDALRDKVSAHFSRAEFTQGICETIAACGESLQVFFPCSDKDINELPDHVHTD